jgi:hypothetical protein
MDIAPNYTWNTPAQCVILLIGYQLDIKVFKKGKGGASHKGTMLLRPYFAPTENLQRYGGERKLFERGFVNRHAETRSVRDSDRAVVV